MKLVFVDKLVLRGEHSYTMYAKYEVGESLNT